ncbi:unnamed protein product [Schistocephalus solidus]|uniref:SH3 domain-containing protein n=1 Tax=Schistocephalus solidus TaxID=70667 RepID=A0A183T600_SCHSO|nr:unnamed protein product [Schistocephalus solidus]
MSTGYTHPPEPPTATYPLASTQPNRAQHGGSWQSETVAYPVPSPSTAISSQPGEGYTNGSSYKPNSFTKRPGSFGDMNYNGAAASGQKTSWEPPQPEVSKNESEPIEFSPPKLILLGGLRVTGSGVCFLISKHFQAVYDYEANESDEVSFKEGDEILHGEPIDDGWMYGTVKRTGKFGMLPSNYVVPIQSSNKQH